MPVNKNSISFPYIFLIINIVLVVGIYFVISKSLENTINSAITNSTQASNTAVTRLFVNEIYPDLSKEFSLSSDKASTKSELSEEELNRVDKRVRQFMFGTDILKAKFYNINGVTLYSSDLSQVGDNKSGNTGFDSVINGTAASQVTHRGKFSSLDGEVFDRDLVASYIPIYDRDNQIIGVAELYTDRSNVITYSAKLTDDIKIELLPLLAGVLLAIALIVWRFQVLVTHLRVQLIEKEHADS